MKRFFYALLLIVCSISAKAQISGNVKIHESDVILSKQESYDVVRLKGINDFTNDVGAPELPLIMKTFVIPANARMAGVEVIVNKRVALDGAFMPYPVQQPIKIDGSVNGFELPADTVYNGSNPYPSIRAEIVADYNLMGYHLISVRFYPVEFEPKTKRIYLNDLGYTLKYQTEESLYKQPKTQSKQRTDVIKKMILSFVDNPQDVRRFSLTAEAEKVVRLSNDAQHMIPNVIEEQIPDYIIITNKELESAFKPLIDWKTQKGTPTVLKTVEEINKEFIGSDLPEKIHNYLKDCRERWGEGLFVLLGGDTDIVPARMYSYLDENNKFYPLAELN